MSSSQVTTDCSKSFRWFFAPDIGHNKPLVPGSCSGGGLAKSCVSFVKRFSSRVTSRKLLLFVSFLLFMKSAVWSRAKPVQSQQSVHNDDRPRLTIMVIVAFPRFIACLAYTAPRSSYWFVLR